MICFLRSIEFSIELFTSILYRHTFMKVFGSPKTVCNILGGGGIFFGVINWFCFTTCGEE